MPPELNSTELNELRALLCDLQNSIRDALSRARRDNSDTDFAGIAGQTQADTIYTIDRVSEAAILAWFEHSWPRDQPVELVMEGLEDGQVACFPRDTPVAQTKWKCILDPIDGTRGLMYDKRSAWSLAGLAPQKGDETRLSDICVAALTELPTSKAGLADQVSGVRGCGAAGLICERIDLRSGERAPFSVRPSSARDFKHGFAAWARFFPEGRTLLSEVDARLWEELYGLGSTSPLIFDDQYISSGGQLFELMVGHDRMQGDLRPLAYKKLGFNSSLVCHPYDVCTFFLAQEAGVVVESPDGSPLDGPLDTISAIAWMGYANSTLAEQVRPILGRLMREYF